MYEYPEKIDEEEVHVKYTVKEPASKQRKWIPWVVLFFGVLFLIIASILTGLHFNRGFDPTCHDATAKRFLEARNLQLTEERDRLNRTLQNIDTYTSEGWVYFRGSFYLGSNAERSWQQSRQFCQERGADLIIITSIEEQEFARVTFKERRWMGLSDLEHEAVWKWVDGSPLTKSFWSDGEPNNSWDEDCGELNKEDGFWNDETCSDQLKCICEKSH